MNLTGTVNRARLLFEIAETVLEYVEKPTCVESFSPEDV
jgi:hypothetical protein